MLLTSWSDVDLQAQSRTLFTVCSASATLTWMRAPLVEAYVDKRRERAKAICQLDANPRTKKSWLFDLTKHFALSSRIKEKDVSMREALNIARKELKTL